MKQKLRTKPRFARSETNNRCQGCKKENGKPILMLKTIITPSEFQALCDRAMLTVDCQRAPADALPYDLATALITEVQKLVCEHLSENYQSEHPLPPNEKRIEALVKMVSQHWSGPILVERTINETIRMVLEHWRERHFPS